MLNTLSKITILAGCGISEVKTEKKCLVPLLQIMNQGPSHFTDVEGRLSFTPFKFILELLFTFPIPHLFNEVKFRKKVKSFSINMTNLK